MENEYKHTNTTVSLIHYHFVFCPRYRRKIFKIEGVEERLKELIASICEEHEMDILALECHIDHVHLFLSAYPQQSHVLRTEFSALKAMPALWTRSYFVSTAGTVSSDTIKQYVETQKSRP